MKIFSSRSRHAVSPLDGSSDVCSTALVLAAVLYVMVSGLITGPGGTPQAMGVSVQPSSDGSNWIVLVLSTPTGKLYTSTTLAIFHGEGIRLNCGTASASHGVSSGCSLAKVAPYATGV